MEKNISFEETVKILKALYKDNLLAMSQIITAEINNDVDVLRCYLECVEKFIKDLKNNL